MHFHYVQSMGAIYALFSALYYWLGKITGYQYKELYARIHFWVFTIAINIVFFPMHFIGLQGMPRRIPDYADGYAEYNSIISYGSCLTADSQLMIVGILLLGGIFYPSFANNSKYDLELIESK